ncbi:2Fe-2S ferredoxin-like protein [Pasteurellaceae bacterium HPA106]|uniref:class I ribonucleotide reductase maintenance protein YfaE n=1 Tax=Spirabiliibacterium pneumoniae TaxID=221400 RepID=UPI001AAD27AF|nr:class I ribonucleotide reductase maintenance protein YfaE [Spirabiliibacterium pneumoniae]MBE2896605.1 2Fe-2S ferredoxin-like protein [Spirabiliibacterium pneumoniae]
MQIYKITLPRFGYTVKHNNDDGSLLETLEKNGIEHEYQCRSGFCGACRVKLLKGEVHYNQPPLASLNPGEMLLCCCKVDSDLEIDF